MPATKLYICICTVIDADEPHVARVRATEMTDQADQARIATYVKVRLQDPAGVLDPVRQYMRPRTLPFHASALIPWLHSGA